MTDKDIADHVYIEPMNLPSITQVIEKERPDALLPNMGGQTGLNLAMALYENGTLEKYGVRLLGTSPESIRKAEDRQGFKDAMEAIGQPCVTSDVVESVEAAVEFAGRIGYPVIVRPAYTLGGSGGGIAYDEPSLREIADRGIHLSRVGQVLIERCISGWKEIEFEVMRDSAGNVIQICSMENIDPVGVHTGDSIVVAPTQTLANREYQMLRSASLNIISALGIEGGCNVQLALNPDSFEYAVIEVNPRVSRSSALASKATGYPIAKVAAKVALGYTLDEIPNAVTGKTTACFEPTLDYCVLKLPRLPFDKFTTASRTLGTQMKATGEVMAIGNSFEGALMKAIRSLELPVKSLRLPGLDELYTEEIEDRLVNIDDQRLFVVAEALRRGFSPEKINKITKYDLWFLDRFQNIVDMEDALDHGHLDGDTLRRAKEMGFSDAWIAALSGREQKEIKALRESFGIRPAFKMVDTCAAEFEAQTPYYYSTYDQENEAAGASRADDGAEKRKVLVLGSGPIRIGQGIEFDYCSVHSVWAFKRLGYETIIINNNPETVSTDFDVADKLYFEPLTAEDVQAVVELEKPWGAVVQFGGQTPLNLAVPLMRAGVPILGTSPDAIDRAEDRERFQALLQKLSLLQPANGTATTLEESREIAHRIGYPIVIRPSYVLGGRAMMIVYDDEEMAEYFALHVGKQKLEHPVLIDKFLENAIEVDVDALSDGEDVYVAGVMEHIEEAGIHSGDSSCVLPPYSLPAETVAEIERQTVALAKELRVVGLMNIQFAIKGDDLYILEVNPRASRTAPFVSKATGVPLPYMATQVMLGKTLDELDPWSMRRGGFTCVKEAVLPFQRFPGVDIILGPEMHSTGEVMGMGSDFPEAYYKSQLASGQDLPQGGNVFISVNDRDKPILPEVAAMFADLGFHLLATSGTARYLRERGLEVEEVLKVYEGRPNIVDRMINGDVALVINTASGKNTARDSKSIRHTAVSYGVPYCTTVAGAKASAIAIGKRREDTHVESLQEYYAREARG